MVKSITYNGVDTLTINEWFYEKDKNDVFFISNHIKYLDSFKSLDVNSI